MKNPPISTFNKVSTPKLSVTNWTTPLILIGLSMAVGASFIGGLTNKPVAEDFADPNGFLNLGSKSQFRPVVGLVFLTLQHLFGTRTGNVIIYHLFSLGVHLGTTLALFFLVRKFLYSYKTGLVVCVAFAFYPRQHETVFWISASTHLLMTFFVILSLISYLRYRQGNHIWLFASVLLFSFGLLSSEAAVAEIPIILSYEVLFNKNISGQNLKAKVYYLARQVSFFILIVILYLSVIVVGDEGISRFFGSRTDTQFYHFSLSPSLLVDLGGYISYALFPFIPIRSLDSVLIKLLIVTMASIILGISFMWGSRGVRFGITWMFFSVLPYVLFVPFGNADRYFYLASIGFSVFGVSLLQIFFKFIKGLNEEKGLLLGRSLSLGIIAIYVYLAYISLQARVQEWKQSGDLVDSLLSQVYLSHPTLDSGTTFYFVGLPTRYGQANFMAYGIESALRTHYKEPKPKVEGTSDPKLIALLKEAVPNPSEKNSVIIYLYNNNKLIDYSASFNDLKVRSLLST